MSVVVDIEGELYGMMVDEVGEITNFNNPDLLDTNPNAVDPRWRQFTLGVYQEDENLIVILDDNLIFNDI
jgi:purine-binding chemotaxis protein CheW